MIFLWLQLSLISSTTTNAFAQFTMKFTNLINIKDFLLSHYQEWSFSAIWIGVWIYFFIFLLTWLVILIRLKTIKKSSRPTIWEKINHYISQMHFSIFFWLINMVLIASWLPQSKDKVMQIGLNNKYFTLWFLDLILIILNYIIGACQSFFGIYPFKDENHLYCTYTSSFQFLTFLAKAIMNLLVIFLEKDDRSAQVLLVITAAVISWTKLYILFKKFPYYHHSAMRIAITWETIAAWIALVNLFTIKLFADDLNWSFDIVIYIDIVPLPIVIKGALAVFNRIIDKYAMMPLKDITSQEMAFKKLFSEGQSIQQSRISLNDDANYSPGEIEFYGHLTAHSKRCGDIHCLCAFILKREVYKGGKTIADLKIKLENWLTYQTKELMVQSMSNIKEKDEIKAVFAHFLLNQNHIGGFSKALFYLSEISNEKAGLFILIKKNILLREAQNQLYKYFLNKNNNNILDMKKFVDFKRHKGEFMSLLLSSTQKYLDFWLYYNQPNFKMYDLLMKHEAIEKEADMIDALWNQHNDTYAEFYYFVHEIYSLFLKLVRNAPYSSYKVKLRNTFKAMVPLTRYETISRITEENMYYADTIVCHVSMAKEKLGKISSISSNVADKLGYGRRELIGKNINSLMPSEIGEAHDKLLYQYVNRTEMSIDKIHRNINSYVRTKKGYIQPCSLYTTILPYIENEITYVSVIRVTPTIYEHMIVTEDGLVDAYTKGIKEQLNLSIKRETYITDIYCNLFSTRNENLTSTEASKHLMTSLVEKFEFITRTSLHSEGSPTATDNPPQKPTLRHSDSFQDFEEGWIKLRFSPLSTSDKEGSLQERLDYDIKLSSQILGKRQVYYIIMRSCFTHHTNRTASRSPGTSPRHRGSPENFFEEEEEGDDIPAERGFNSVENILTPRVSSSRNLIRPTAFAYFNSQSNQKNEDVTSDSGIGTPSSPPDLRFRGVFRFPTVEINEALESKNIRSRKDNPLRAENLTNGRPPYSNRSPMNEEEHHNVNETSVTKYNEETLSIMNSTDLKAKVEKAVYKAHTPKLLRFFNVPTYLLLLSCIGVFSYLTRSIGNSLRHVSENVDILTYSSYRLDRILESKRLINLLVLLQNNITTNEIFQTAGINDLGLTIKKLLPVVQDELRTSNNKLRNFLNQTDISLQREFYNYLIPLEPDLSSEPTLYQNTLDAGLTFVSRISTISNSFPDVLTNTTSDIDFVYKNSLNGLLMTSEEIYNVTIQDNHYKFGKIKDLSLGLMLGFLFLGILTSTTLLRQLSKMNIARVRLIDIFMRIDDKEINIALKPVVAFESYLAQANLQEQSLKFKNSKKMARKHEQELAENRNRRNNGGFLVHHRKNVNMDRLNFRIILMGALIVFMVLIMVFPYFHVFIMMAIKDAHIKDKVDTIVEVNRSLYEILLMYVSFYDYVLSKGTATLRNEPIDTMWEGIYKARAGSESYFSTLLLSVQQDSSFDKQTLKIITQLISGNLCKMLSNVVQDSSRCYIVMDGNLLKGIQSAYSYNIYTLRNAKTGFDQSAKTADDIKAALNSAGFLSITVSMRSWQYLAYEQLGQIFGESTQKLVNHTKHMLEKLLAIYLVFYLLVVTFLAYHIKSTIKTRFDLWMKIIRKVPVDIILSNKQLKSLVFLKGSQFVLIELED